ncbi:histidine kinase [Streptomyces albidoflavus]|nr:histidine kinase [Streptomyces albidoflavus]
MAGWPQPSTPDRMTSLLDAVMGLGRGLELPEVLHGIVRAAVTLTGARYGALGIIDDGRSLSEFLPVGMDEETAARIGTYPCGRGILGELIQHPEPLRLTDLSQHPRSYGFPAHHPPMRTFLGVPVRVRDKIFGNLYLTEKQGGGDFDADDEAVLTTLSIAAGVAIDNARMYDESRRRERRLEALGDITRSLLSGTGASEVLHLIAERAMAVAGADSAAVLLPSGDEEPARGGAARTPADAPAAGEAADGAAPAPPAAPAGVCPVAHGGPAPQTAPAQPEPGGHLAAGSLTVDVAEGYGASRILGLTVPKRGSLAGLAAVTGSPVSTSDIRTDPRAHPFDAIPVTGTDGPDPAIGPVVAVPLQVGSGRQGALRLGRIAGRASFDDSDVELVSGFADQAAIALELARRRAESEELVVLHDRDRIARDLHDLAIQRLFATGMTLQSTTRAIADRPAAAERVSRAVDDLDTTIRIIRSTIFDLRAADEPGHPGLRRRLAETTQTAAHALGFRPSLRIDGPVDTTVPDDLAEQLLAVAAEALSNAARHAAATRIDVTVTATDEALTLTVTDDGKGIDPAGPARHTGGLANMRHRAESHRGTFTLTDSPSGGTRVRWRVPLRA